MTNHSEQNKRAWEHNVYDFWLREAGAPAERAKKAMGNPAGMLKRYAKYFDAFQNVKVANICGSCGKKAIPLALLGADVTVFDISEDNRRYALEFAEAADVEIRFETCDILGIDLGIYGGCFDVVFMEGGILHYFHDIDKFMSIMYSLLRKGGKLICSDFHPFTKIADILEFGQPAMSYFDTESFEGEMAHARFLEDESREQAPKCSYRKYTISEILNAVMSYGFTMERFDEHPAWTNPDLPGEFTVIARK